MTRKKDISSKKFGKLTAIEFCKVSGRTYWNCLCECGNFKKISLSNLVGGKTKSCGCLHKESMRAKALDLTGKKFGLLTVIKINTKKTIAKKIVWECLCKCGQITASQTNNLRSGNTTSCGSAIHWGIAENDIRLYQARYNHYKSGAKRRGLLFELTINEFKDLVDKPCHYCGKKNSYKIRKPNSILREKMVNGIDRIDSQKGYSQKNCVPCCTRCNEMKNDTSYVKFLEEILSIVNHLGL